MKLMIITGLTLFLLALTAGAEQTYTYGWEDGIGTVLGTFGNVGSVENTDEIVQSDTRSLKAVEDPIDGTPQLYIWWVTGLTDGDTVESSFYGYAPNDNTYARQRIWAHYTSDPNDIDSYATSAGGNETYTSDIGLDWQQVTNKWIMNTSGGTNDGIVIEARMYSGTTDASYYTHYIDTTAITVSSDTAVIHRADGTVVPEPSALVLAALLGMFLKRK